MTAKTAAPVKDLETILAPPVIVELQGHQVAVQHMKTREFFSFLGIFTSTLGGGAAQALSELKDKEGEEIQGEILGLVLVCLPLAVDPVLKLVKDITRPVDPEDAHWLMEYLDNPEMEDLMAVVDAVIENEKDNLSELVGKARMYFTKWSQVMKKKTTTTTTRTGSRGRKSST
jgi:hypothetical protein